MVSSTCCSLFLQTFLSTVLPLEIQRRTYLLELVLKVMLAVSKTIATWITNYIAPEQLPAACADSLSETMRYLDTTYMRR